MARKSYSVTIEENIKDRFVEKCKAENTNQSQLIEMFMRAYVNGHVKLALVNDKIETQMME